MKNAYAIDGQVVSIKVVRRDNTQHIVLVDLTALPSLEGCKISVCKHGIGFCAKVSFEGESQYLHRYLKDAPEGAQVDHFDGNGLNNRDLNLRLATHAENSQNKQVPAAHNKSGVRGVSWQTEKGKWWAKVRLNGKAHHLGYYTDLSEAEKVVTEFRKNHMPFSQEASK